MMTADKKLHASLCVFLLSLLLPAATPAAQNPSRLVVFGDSLSDPGNAFVFTGMALTPPYTALVPDYPYARGGHHLSNGSTWIERLATKMRQVNTVGPALRVPGVFSNYAIDRSRACSNSASPSHIDLSTQVGQFLSQFGGAPGDALYVLFIGGNDVRDALDTANPALIGCALMSIQDNISALVNSGARNFLVANVPNLGLLPAVILLGPAAQQAATEASLFFNAQLEAILSGVEAATGGLVFIYRLDTFALITEAPMRFPGLNLTEPCINVFDGSVCAPAKDYLFWDGIHPTVTGHSLLAEEAASVLGLH